MQNNGNLNSLAERMKAKVEQERQEIEALTRQQFEALKESLSESSKNALSTTEAAILHQLSILKENVSNHCRLLNGMFVKKWIQILLITVSILMGTALGGWGIWDLIGHKVTSLHREIAILNNQKVVLEKTIIHLEDKTWGVRLAEGPEGRFIILPVKGTLKPGWTFGQNPAWKVE